MQDVQQRPIHQPRVMMCLCEPARTHPRAQPKPPVVIYRLGNHVADRQLVQFRVGAAAGQ
ncbi:Uncharacterised protein [Mycobacteroides abscessus subsp. abscessus]|nr:Uncharacterised protein [Mycobacteroides abscessus subsp. abscessus]